MPRESFARPIIRSESGSSGSSFDTFSARAGHSLTFIKTQDGLAYYLVWGGTAQSSTARIGEVLRQSSRQADGVDGNYGTATKAPKTVSTAAGDGVRHAGEDISKVKVTRPGITLGAPGFA